MSTAMTMSADMGGSYPISFDVQPSAPQSRVSVFFRIILAIPHLLIFYFLGGVQSVVTLIAWFAIVITGKYPEGLLKFSIGVHRWGARVMGYATLLTDKYPPFSMDDDSSYPIRYQVQAQSEGRNRLTTFFRIFM